MNQIRTIRKIITGKNTIDGAGVKLVRVFGYHDTKEFDPFLMLDAFDSDNPEDYIKGFPWHPHRGIETITYLIEGEIEHGDSLGNIGTIQDGQCQWMTAGSGIIHQEMPQPSKIILGVQLWLNLPSKDKMTVPKYRFISKQEIPVFDETDRKIHVIAGKYKGRLGATEGNFVNAMYLDIELNANAEWAINVHKEDTLFVYILKGDASFGDDLENFIKEKHAVLFNEGNKFNVKASEKGARLLLMAGKPLHEPIAWGGPIVMNTSEELELSFRELEENTFVK